MKKIPLTQGKFTTVDDCDYEYLNQWKWCCSNGYAVRNSGRIYLHREILSLQGFKDFPATDHKNGNKLDNRRQNLRPATTSQNHYNAGKRSHNTSGFKGVYRVKSREKWRAQIRVAGKYKHLGYFDRLEEAVSAYNKAAKKYHGKFAHLNKM